MILGLDIHPAAACLVELDDALEALAPGRYALNCHSYPGDIPPGRVVFQTENVPGQVKPTAFEGYEIHDFSELNIAAWGSRHVTHVPIGYHSSMERFRKKPDAECDIDVVLMGCMSDRRKWLMTELERRGLRIAHIPHGTYGKERDAILARSRMALNLRFYPDGINGGLRIAHCVANHLPVISEMLEDNPWWDMLRAPYEDMADTIERWLAAPGLLKGQANEAYRRFTASPMVLPTPGQTKASKAARSAWSMLLESPDKWDLELMYNDARGGTVSPTPLVAIAMPRYRESGRIVRLVDKSLERVEDDLARHGIGTGRIDIEGDSLVTRMRQRVCQMFLRSKATHLLFCDADIEVMNPMCVRHMLYSGFGVVAGACPFKSSGRRVVCNLWPETELAMQDGASLALPKGCIEVKDAGTGFMLIRRHALIRMMQANPELLHWSQSDQDRGDPLFALFDTGVVDGVYQSEDFRFCRYWQALGEKVYVYVPATFRHWGEHGYEGSFAEQYGLEPRRDEASP